MIIRSNMTEARKVLSRRQILPDGSSPDGAPDFLMLLTGAAAPRPELAQMCRDLGIGALHGATSCKGAMANAGTATSEQADLGVFAIWDADGDFGTACKPFGDNPQDAAMQATRAALTRADRPGEAPDVVFVSSAPGNEERVLAGITAVVGTDVPILGGSCADDEIAGKWAVFDGTGETASGLVVSVLFPSTEVSVSFQSGYAPTDRSGIVTRAEGRRVFEIDNLPATERYSAWTGTDFRAPQGAPRQILSESTFSPLGRRIADVSDVHYHLLLHPAFAHPDGSMELFADVAVGERLHLMTGSPDSLISRAGRVAQQCRDDLPEDTGIAGAVVVYCAGCMLAVEDRMNEVVTGLNSALNGAPFLGDFTFGEQGPVLGGENRHANLMISCIAFGTERST